MAQYAVLLYADDSAHAPDATDQDLSVHDRHADELLATGAMNACFALTPRDMATTIHDDLITDGPFIDSKEVIVGFYILDVPDLDAALAIAKTNPALRWGAAIEIRPVHTDYLRATAAAAE